MSSCFFVLTFGSTHPTLHSSYQQRYVCWPNNNEIHEKIIKNLQKSAVVYVLAWLVVQKLIDTYLSIIMVSEWVQYQGKAYCDWIFNNDISWNPGKCKIGGISLRPLHITLQHSLYGHVSLSTLLITLLVFVNEWWTFATRFTDYLLMRYLIPYLCFLFVALVDKTICLFVFLVTT